MKKDTKMEVAKGLANFVCGTGTGMIVNNIVTATMPFGAGIVTRIFTAIGGYTIAVMAGEKVGKYAEEKIEKSIIDCTDEDDEEVVVEQVG